MACYDREEVLRCEGIELYRSCGDDCCRSGHVAYQRDFAYVVAGAERRNVAARGADVYFAVRDQEEAIGMVALMDLVWSTEAETGYKFLTARRSAEGTGQGERRSGFARAGRDDRAPTRSQS